MSARAAVPLAEVVVLGVWIGAALLFTAVVAPAAFAVLPSRTLAGALVGRVLPILFYAGIVTGALVVLLDVLVRSGAWWRIGGGAVALVACAAAQFVVGARIERLRVAIGGPLDALAADDPRRLEFGALHAISVAWLGLAMAAAAVVLVLAVRALLRH
jgi:hypothetical protein